MSTHSAFPNQLPNNKPTDRPLSKAMQRFYDNWNGDQDAYNEFYTTFKYSRLTGIGKDESEMSVSRRDPSKVIKVDDTYYVWYTRRITEQDPVGRDNVEAGTEDIPIVDWDLADICYATSKDGFHWEEQGVAVGRAGTGTYGDRSLSTPDILVYKGRYYLYYQTFTQIWDAHDCVSVSMAWADSPDGPWTRLDRPVVEQGADGEWDSCAIHDPYPLVYQGKIWLYYKGAPKEWPQHPDGYLLMAQGVAIADHPEGPYIKPDLNPLTNAGHETMLWPYRDGIASLLILDGPEKDTVQYAPDGLNFEPKAHVQLPPNAAGPYCPDAFLDNGDGQGITWGLCHIIDHKRRKSFIVRFDCELSRANRHPEFKDRNPRLNEHTHFQDDVRLPDEWKARILAEQESSD